MILAVCAVTLANPAVARTLRLIGGSCAVQDMAVRSALQNKLADVCVEMCKEVGAYPEGCKCPDYTDTTDTTPGVTTWDELLTYMGDIKVWSQDTLKGRHGLISTLQQKAAVSLRHSQAQLEASGACLAEDL